MADDPATAVEFATQASIKEPLQVASLQGIEGVSRTYEFHLDLQTRQTDLKLEELVRAPAYIGMKVPVAGGGGARMRAVRIHGVLTTFEQLDKVGDFVRCRAVLVPRLWKLSLTVQSRVFLKKDIKEIVKDVLEWPSWAKRFTSKDYEFRCSGSYVKHEYVSQYQESDLDFLSRWLEHEGIFYFFEQSDEGEKIIFCDNTSGYLSLPGNPTIPYRPTSEGKSRAPGIADGETATEEAVRSFICRMRDVCSKVVLKDYNPETPSAAMLFSHDVDEDSEGEAYFFAEDVKTEDEGFARAKMRAEQIRCGKKVFTGKGDVRSFRAGAKFPLAEHFRSDFNGGAGYMITEVRHKASQAIGSTGTPTGSLVYENEFTCIPADIPFRPECRTPWPQMAGYMNAKVDAGGDGKYAEIDDHGRYKVKLPLDRSDLKDGKASWWMRMAQPYAGGSMGMHFPLHKGAEVFVAFEHGDPDRPIIASSVPNPETASPVCGPNQTQSVILTGGGNKIVIEDTDGEQQILIESPTKGTKMTMGHDPSKPGFNASTDAFRKTDIGADDLLTVSGNQEAAISGNCTQDIGGNETLTVGGSQNETIGGSRTQNVGGAETVSVGGASTFSAGGARKETSGGPWALTAPKLSIVIASKIAIASGAKTEVAAGAAINLTTGANFNLMAAGKNQQKSSGVTQIQAGGKMDLKAGGPLNATAPTINIKGNTNIQGTTKVKGDTTIKGATKIDGATQIKGATKVTGETKINGTFKVKGTTFVVS